MEAGFVRSHLHLPAGSRTAPLQIHVAGDLVQAPPHRRAAGRAVHRTGALDQGSEVPAQDAGVGEEQQRPCQEQVQKVAVVAEATAPQQRESFPGEVRGTQAQVGSAGTSAWSG